MKNIDKTKLLSELKVILDGLHRAESCTLFHKIEELNQIVTVQNIIKSSIAALPKIKDISQFNKINKLAIDASKISKAAQFDNILELFVDYDDLVKTLPERTDPDVYTVEIANLHRKIYDTYINNFNILNQDIDEVEKVNESCKKERQCL